MGGGGLGEGKVSFFKGEESGKDICRVREKTREQELLCFLGAEKSHGIFWLDLLQCLLKFQLQMWVFRKERERKRE